MHPWLVMVPEVTVKLARFGKCWLGDGESRRGPGRGRVPDREVEDSPFTLPGAPQGCNKQDGDSDEQG